MQRCVAEREGPQEVPRKACLAKSDAKECRKYLAGVPGKFLGSVWRGVPGVPRSPEE